VTCAISWGRCSLVGLLVVISVVVVLVLLLFSFPVDCELWEATRTEARPLLHEEAGNRLTKN